MLTDAAGEPTAKFTYDAYGNPEASTGSQTTPFGYAGQYTLSESGLQYLRARVYDPVTGQFLTRDPIEELTHEPYSYAGDNPQRSSDPSGLEEIREPCVWPCPPPPLVKSFEKAAHEIGKALNDTLNAIFGDGEDTASHPTLSKAEERNKRKSTMNVK